MTGGLGFVRAGKDRSRQNRDLLKHTDRVMSKKGEATHGQHIKPKYKEATKEEIDHFMEGFKASQKKDRKRRIILAAVVVLVVTMLLYLIIW